MGEAEEGKGEGSRQRKGEAEKGKGKMRETAAVKGTGIKTSRPIMGGRVKKA